MQKLSKKITDILSEGNVIQEEDKDRCCYGLEVMLSSVSEILCVIIISLLVGNFIETLIFFTAFIPLRVYAGGYHADTRIRCFGILIGVYAVFSVFLHYADAEIYKYIVMSGTFFTVLAVVKLAPVRHSRKHLTSNEIRAFRKIAIKICIFQTVLILVFVFTVGENIYLMSFVSGQLAVSISMVMACIKEKMRGGKLNEEVL